MSGMQISSQKALEVFIVDPEFKKERYDFSGVTFDTGQQAFIFERRGINGMVFKVKIKLSPKVRVLKSFRSEKETAPSRVCPGG